MSKQKSTTLEGYTQPLYFTNIIVFATRMECAYGEGTL